MKKLKFQKKCNASSFKYFKFCSTSTAPPPSPHPHPPPSLPNQLNFLDMPILDRLNKSSDFPTSMVYKCKSIQNNAI